MGKLTYLDKVALNENPDIPDINKVSEFLREMQFYSFIKGINKILSKLE